MLINPRVSPLNQVPAVTLRYEGLLGTYWYTELIPFKQRCSSTHVPHYQAQDPRFAKWQQYHSRWIIV